MAQKNVNGETFNLVMLANTLGVPIDPSSGTLGPDRELVVTTYVAKNAFAGASVGDTITLTQVIDVSGTPSTVANIWRNQTTATDLGAAPTSADLEFVGSQALTNAQLRASAVPVSAASLPLPTGAATEATLVTLATEATVASIDAAVATLATEVTTASIDAKLPATIGQKTSAGSLAVVLASDTPALSVTGPLTDTQLRAAAVPVSAASLPLPSGAATEATLATLATDAAVLGISGQLPAALGQTTSAASLAVVLASDSPAVPVSGPLTDTQLRATDVPVSGPLTDAQLRASVVPVSLPALTTATEAFSTETGSFTIAAGAISYSVINVGAASFVFQGVTIPVSVLAIDGAPLGTKTYPALAGDATGTTVIVQRTA